MSRGGRGGGRGGAKGGRPNVPWDTGDEPDARPSELFPPYSVPTFRDLSTAEISSVQHFLLLRHQIHSSPLYTSRKTLSHDDPATPRKLYGQAQMNARYGLKNKAAVDPFTAMPTYSEKFVREERALPDWSARPVCREMFPPELLDTVEPQDGVGVRKKRRLELSKVSALPSAEEAFGLPALDGGEGNEEEEGTAPLRGKNLLERLDALRDEEGADDGAELEDEDGLEDEDEDEVYDDEDAGDYDAENYFDNGDDMGDDYGDGDDGEGTY
ncbi:hypothetical protein E4U41_000008 [Claviceps citrina]|nr:hypothetical protein E4U41_000008 [Claviceps citrina]